MLRVRPAGKLEREDASVKCQAEAMALFHFEDEDIEKCENEAEENVDGYELCGPCATALATFVNISRRAVDENR